MRNILPNEVIQLIFLHCDFKTLCYTRDLQTKQTKNITQYNTLFECILYNKKKNGKWLIHYKKHDITSLLYTAVHMNDTNTLDFLFNCNIIVDLYLFIQAAKIGNLQVITYLFNKNCPWNEEVFNTTLLYSHTNNIQFLLDNACPMTNCTFNAAVSIGNLHIMQLLINYNCPVDNTIFGVATIHDSTIILDWLYNNTSCKMITNTFEDAIITGSHNAIEWLVAHNCPWSDNLILVSIQHVFYEATIFLIHNECPISHSIFADCIAHENCIPTIKDMLYKYYPNYADF